MMRAHQIMTKTVITVSSRTILADAANLMLRNHISGLPVVDNGVIVGVVSESDFLRRREIGTGRKRAAWLTFLLGPDRATADFVRERGRRIEDIMTTDAVTVAEDTPLEDLVCLMEKKNIKRLPGARQRPGRDRHPIELIASCCQFVAGDTGSHCGRRQCP
jgi:CBS domain-containing protein